MRHVGLIVASGLAVLALAAGAAAEDQARPVRTSGSQDHRPGGQAPGGSPPRGIRWWQDYKTELKLTPEQASRIEEIFQGTFPKLRASYEELSKREDQLSSLISSNDATEAEVLRQADQIESIRGELSKTRVLMLFRMRRVLSPEQRSKLQALQKEHERERGGGPPPPRR